MKKITDSLSEQRHKQQLSLKQISQATKIPIAQLASLEKGLWQNFSSDAYLQGVLKKYAAFLGLDPEKYSLYLKREINEKKVQFIRVNDYHNPQPQFAFGRTIYALVLLVIFFFGLQIYLSWQKPLLTLNKVPTVILVGKPLQIKGQTEKGVLLYLNDEPIYQDEQGKFSETLYYKTRGERNLELKAIGVNGQEQKYTFTIKVKDAKT